MEAVFAAIISASFIFLFAALAVIVLG